MQIHGPSEQPASIGVRLNPGANGPFAVVDFGSTRIYVESIADADMLIKAYQLGDGDIEPLSDGEVAANAGARAGFTLERGWENWCRLTDRPYYSQDWNMGPGFSKTDK